MKGEVVGRYMSRGPFTVGRLQPLSFAHQEMRKHGIRHLPVLDEGLLVGMVSLRDLHLIETLRDVDPDTVAVEDAMTSGPFTVGPDSPLRDVIEGMIERRYGSAVVVEGEAVVGVFTTLDALRALLGLLGRGRKARAPGKGAARPGAKKAPGQGTKPAAKRTGAKAAAPRPAARATRAAKTARPAAKSPAAAKKPRAASRR